jgi:hypothetical protein
MWTKLRQIFRILTSTQIEATYDPIAYHASARGEPRFSQASSLRRHC